MDKQISLFPQNTTLAKTILIVLVSMSIYDSAGEASSKEKMLLKEEEQLTSGQSFFQRREKDSPLTLPVERNEMTKPSVLDALPKDLSPLKYSQELMTTVIDSGFRWKNIHQVISKVKKELKEVEECISGNRQENLEEELGDLLLATVTLCTYLQEDPEESLSCAIKKFEKRFRKVEENLNKTNMNMKNMTLEQILEAWKKAKA